MFSILSSEVNERCEGGVFYVLEVWQVLKAVLRDPSLVACTEVEISVRVTSWLYLAD
jgi:hypothetical protein